jgi:hypothetical protein
MPQRTEIIGIHMAPKSDVDDELNDTDIGRISPGAAAGQVLWEIFSSQQRGDGCQRRQRLKREETSQKSHDEGDGRAILLRWTLEMNGIQDAIGRLCGWMGTLKGILVALAISLLSLPLPLSLLTQKEFPAAMKKQLPCSPHPSCPFYLFIQVFSLSLLSLLLPTYIIHLPSWQAKEE